MGGESKGLAMLLSLITLSRTALGGGGGSIDLLEPRATGAGRVLDPGWLPGGVILDFDPSGLIRTGIDASDDLAALTLLGAASQVRLLGLTVTYGTSLLAFSRKDAHQLAQLAGIGPEVPIVSGADWSTSSKDQNKAAQFMVDTVSDNPPHTITLVCLGPLSNAAAALELGGAPFAERLRAIVMSGGSRKTPGSLWDLNLLVGDRSATRAVLQANTPRVLVPRDACTQAPMTSRLLKAAQSMCPGAAACEYIKALQHAVERGEGKRGWIRDVWEALMGKRESGEPAEAQETVESRPDSTASSGGGGGGGSADDESGSRPEAQDGLKRLRKASKQAGERGAMCDLIAAGALVAPYGFREWDVLRLEVEGWGLEWGIVQLGFGADEAQALVGSARFASGQETEGFEAKNNKQRRRRLHHKLPPSLRPLVVDWRVSSADNKDEATLDSTQQAVGAEEGQSWPVLFVEDGTRLTDAGVVLVPSIAEPFPVGESGDTVPAPLVHALALAFSVPHAEPFREMRGLFEDEGLLNPYLIGPIVWVVSSVVCCVACIAVFCVRTGCRTREKLAGKDA